MTKLKDGFQGQYAYVIPPSYIEKMEQHPLGRLLHITDIGYYPIAKHHYRARIEPIRQYILIYCVDGSGWYEIDNKLYRVKKNHYFVLPADTPHRYGADENEPWTIYWIHFKGEMAAYFAQLNKGVIEVPVSEKSRVSDRLILIDEMMQLFEHGYRMDNLLFSTTILFYFMGSLSYIDTYRISRINKQSTCEISSMAIHYMTENRDKQLDLKDIAHYVGLSSSHFSALFTKQVGISPIHYFNQLKIQHVCTLLDTSDLKINQICYKVGIKDCYYLTRLFTKTMGMSPSAYKKMEKG